MTCLDLLGEPPWRVYEPSLHCCSPDSLCRNDGGRQWFHATRSISLAMIAILALIVLDHRGRVGCAAATQYGSTEP